MGSAGYSHNLKPPSPCFFRQGMWKGFGADYFPSRREGGHVGCWRRSQCGGILLPSSVAHLGWSALFLSAPRWRWKRHRAPLPSGSSLPPLLFSSFGGFSSPSSSGQMTSVWVRTCWLQTACVDRVAQHCCFLPHWLGCGLPVFQPLSYPWLALSH
jgi:hypothetical protein